MHVVISGGGCSGASVAEEKKQPSQKMYGIFCLFFYLLRVDNAPFPGRWQWSSTQNQMIIFLDGPEMIIKLGSGTVFDSIISECLGSGSMHRRLSGSL